MSNIAIRRVVADDSVAIARLAKQTFLDAFAEHNKPENIQAYVSTAFTPAKISYEIREPDAVFFVALRDARLIGYAKLSLGNTADNVPKSEVMELERIYVRKEEIGAGIGRLLMDAVVKHAVRDRMKYLWLGVWNENPEAIAFYRKCGFVIVGSKPFMMGKDLQEDYVMLLTIAHQYDVQSMIDEQQ